jgi:hypothetical protein
LHVRINCILFLVAGCAYQPGSFTSAGVTFTGQTATIGCIDLAATSVLDNRATGPVVRYAFGNRCDHNATLDLMSIRAVGHDTTGQTHELALFDPNREVKPAKLDARFAGTEQLAYLDPDLTQFSSVCVDVGGIDPSVPKREDWLCVQVAS